MKKNSKIQNALIAVTMLFASKGLADPVAVRGQELLMAEASSETIKRLVDSQILVVRSGDTYSVDFVRAHEILLPYRDAELIDFVAALEKSIGGGTDVRLKKTDEIVIGTQDATSGD